MVIREEIEVGRMYKPIGIVYMKNGCCKDRPVVLTRSICGAYSAQCACDGWCTGGHMTATAAIKEYEHMSAGRGIWNVAALGEKIMELEACVLGVDNWENPTDEEITEVRKWYGDD